VNFVDLEKAQWQRKESPNIPLAPAAMSKARCGAINEALRRAAGAGKAGSQKSQAGYCDRTLKGAEERKARTEEKKVKITASRRRLIG
jgi:hypothetical protein